MVFDLMFVGFWCTWYFVWFLCLRMVLGICCIFGLIFILLFGCWIRVLLFLRIKGFRVVLVYCFGFGDCDWCGKSIFGSRVSVFLG